MHTHNNTLTTNKRSMNKLVLGFVGIAATTVIGTAGIAAAAQQTRDQNAPNPPSKAACANFAQYGFRNHGQCVSWWETHNNPGHGYGYGGGSVSTTTTNNVSTNIGNSQHGNNNVFSVVLHYFFG